MTEEVARRLFKCCKVNGWDLLSGIRLSHATSDDVAIAARHSPFISQAANTFLRNDVHVDAAIRMHETLKAGKSVCVYGKSGSGKTYFVQWYLGMYLYDSLWIVNESIKTLKQFHQTSSITLRKKVLIMDGIKKGNPAISRILKESKVPVIIISEEYIALPDELALEPIEIVDTPETRFRIISTLFGVELNEDSEAFSIVTKAQSLNEAINVMKGGGFYTVDKKAPAREITERILADPNRKRVFDVIMSAEVSMGTIFKYLAANIPSFFKKTPEIMASNFKAAIMAERCNYVTKKDYVAAILAYSVIPARGTRGVTNPFYEFDEESKPVETAVPIEKEEKKASIKKENKKTGVLDLW